MIAACISLLRGVPLLESLYRALLVMFLTAVVTALFFRYFTHLLYDFCNEPFGGRSEGARTG